MLESPKRPKDSRFILMKINFNIFTTRTIGLTTQLIQHVETMSIKGNWQLREQLCREDPYLDQAVEEREKSAKRKECIFSPKSSIKRETSGKGKHIKKKPPVIDAVSRSDSSNETRMTTWAPGMSYLRWLAKIRSADVQRGCTVSAWNGIGRGRIKHFGDK